MSDHTFSNQLEKWLKGKHHKTLASLIDVFEDKSFAIVFLLLMILPALPLPTGGVTHIFEIIVALLALEMIIGFKTIWLPKKWKHMKLGKTIEGKVIPLLLRRIRWFEKYSNPRWSKLFTAPLIPQLLGILILVFTAFAFISPPFTGLDTLPALGVVIISLAIILEDALLFAAGIVVGVAGATLTIGAGTALVTGVHHIL